MVIVKDNEIVGVQGQIDTTPANNHLYYSDDSDIANMYPSYEISGRSDSGNTLIRKKDALDWANKSYDVMERIDVPANDIIFRNNIAPVNIDADYNMHRMVGWAFKNTKTKDFFIAGRVYIQFRALQSNVTGENINQSPGDVYFRPITDRLASYSVYNTTQGSRVFRYGIGSPNGLCMCMAYANMIYVLSGNAYSIKVTPNIAGSVTKNYWLPWSQWLPVYAWGKLA